MSLLSHFPLLFAMKWWDQMPWKWKGNHSVMSNSLGPHVHSMEFSRPEYWSGYPFPSPGCFSNPGIEPRSIALLVDSLPAEPQGKPKNTGVGSLSLFQWFFLTQELNRVNYCIAGRIFISWAIREAPGASWSCSDLSFLNVKFQASFFTLFFLSP